MLIPEKQTFEQYEPEYHEWLITAIEEKFDDAIINLEEGCIVYGGAVRDLLAGLPIGGDCDVAVPSFMFNDIVNRFNTSVRWVPADPVLNADGSTPFGSGNPTTAKKVVSSVRTYKNINGYSVQIIGPENKENIYIHDIQTGVVDIVRNVDIVCCGVFTDIFGNLYEIVPGAIEDCKNRVLRFNHDIQATKASIEALKKRINKLEERGWENNIDLDSIKVVEAPKSADKEKLFRNFTLK